MYKQHIYKPSTDIGILPGPPGILGKFGPISGNGPGPGPGIRPAGAIGLTS